MTRSTPSEPTDEPTTQADVDLVACWIGGEGEALAGTLAGLPSGEDLEFGGRGRVDAVGGERRASAAAWAARFGAAECGSLRELAMREQSTTILLGEEPGLDDLRLLLDRERRVVLTRLPRLDVAIGLGDAARRIRFASTLAGLDAIRVADRIVGELRGLPGAGGEGAEARQTVRDGGVLALNLKLRGSAGPRGMESHLLDACALASRYLGPFESVVAFGRIPIGTDRPFRVGVLGRDASGRVAALDVAESQPFDASVEWLLADGRVAADDTNVRVWDALGGKTETIQVAAPYNELAVAARAIVRAARLGLVDRESPDEHAGFDLVNAIALADAARLSLRTGNPEAPQRLVELAARP